jgi:hypothetical protein
MERLRSTPHNARHRERAARATTLVIASGQHARERGLAAKQSQAGWHGSAGSSVHQERNCEMHLADPCGPPEIASAFGMRCRAFQTPRNDVQERSTARRNARDVL